MPSNNSRAGGLTTGAAHPPTRTVDASEAQQDWKRLLASASSKESRVLAEEGGVPVAAMVSTADLERLTRWEHERSRFFDTLREAAD